MMQQPISDFVDRLGSTLGMKLAVVEPLRAREGVCYKVEGNGEEMLLKFVDAEEGGPAVERRVRSFAEVGAEVFPELERVLMWLLERDRGQRCPTFEAALAALEAVQTAFL